MNRVLVLRLLYICSAAGRTAKGSAAALNVSDADSNFTNIQANPYGPISEFNMDVEYRTKDRYRQCTNSTFGTCDVKCSTVVPGACNEDNTECNTTACDTDYNPDGTRLYVHAAFLQSVECNCNGTKDSVHVRWKGNPLPQCEQLEETGLAVHRVLDAHVSNETIMERLWSKLLEMREMRDQGTVTAVDMIMRRNDINEKVSVCVQDLEKMNNSELAISTEMEQLDVAMSKLDTQIADIQMSANATGGGRWWNKIVGEKHAALQDLRLAFNASFTALESVNDTGPERLHKCQMAANALQNFDVSLPYFLENQFKVRNETQTYERLWHQMHQDYMKGVIELGGWISRLNGLSGLYQPLHCDYFNPPEPRDEEPLGSPARQLSR